jgi:3-dehydroquinate dehydratase I
MDALAGVKIPAVVGVITSAQELRAAVRMRRPPDLFELRLDHLPALDPRRLSKLCRPLIITARHPDEGGKKIRGDRSDLLLKFLPRAQYIDVELRSLRELGGVWKEAARLCIKRVCSVHDFARTPPHAHLQKQFQRAKRAGADIFKLVTRADTPDDLLALLQLLGLARSPCCVMATGKFGQLSRLLFPEFGSVFVYAALGRSLYPGQPTLDQLRRLWDFYAKI